MSTGAVRAVTSGLDKLMEDLAASNKRRGWEPLANAKRAAEVNDKAWDEKLTAAMRSYYESDKHDRAYWHEVLDGHVTAETFEELMASMGLT